MKLNTKLNLNVDNDKKTENKKTYLFFIKHDKPINNLICLVAPKCNISNLKR